MNTLLNELVAQVDLLESQRPHSLAWKPFLEQVISEMSSVQTPHENDTNPLYRSLANQSELQISLILVSIIAGMSK